MEKSVQKQMAEKLLEASEDKINRNIKDSVFCDLFGKPEYLIQLYRVLHPEDLETQQEDLTIVTLSRIIVREMYNDLGFLAGNRLLVLVEAQSKPGNREQNISHLWKPLNKRLSAFCKGKNRERQ